MIDSKHSVLLLAAALLTACGGSTVDDNAPPPPAADATMLLPFVTAAGELRLLDPAAPGTVPANTDTGLSAAAVSTGMLRILDGSYDAATNDLSDAHFRLLAYIKGGQLYRVDLQKGASATPVRISNITDACRLVDRAQDYADPLEGWLEVDRKGADGLCSGTDNVRSFVRLSAGSSTAGFTPTPPFTVLTSLPAADGSLGGFLVQQGAATAPELRRYAADFGSSVQVAQLAASSLAEAGPAPSRTRHYLRLRQAGDSTYELYRYDASNDQLASLHAYTASSADSLAFGADADDLHLYFSDANKLWRVGHGVAAPELLHTAAPETWFPGLTRTSSRVVVIRFNTTTSQQGLYSLPQAGNTPTLTTLEADSAADIDIQAVAGSRVYYSLDETTAVANNDSGTARGAGAGIWGGFLYGASLDLGGLNLSLFLDHLVLQRTGDDTFAAVTANTGAVSAILGTSASSDSSFGFNVGRYVLLNVDMGTTNDVYFADVRTAGSLRPVASTANLDDGAP